MYTQSSDSNALWFATALLPDGWVRRVRLTMQAGRIESIDTNIEPHANDERHAIGIAGICNVHSHAFQRALAGLTEHSRGGDDFWSWREAMYGLVEKLTPDHLEAIATYAFAEMLEAGFTRVGEFHYLHHSPDGSPYANIGEHADRLAAAASVSGIGLTLLPVFYAHGGIGGIEPKPAQRRFVNTLDAFERLLDAATRAVKNLPFANVGIAAHSVRAVTPEELTILTHIEHDGPIHMHIAEQLAEVTEWQQWAGARPVDWLLDHYPIDARWCLVHATHVSSSEVERMASVQAVVGLCPITEANLGDGVFPARTLVQLEGRFGIGSDSNVLIDAAAELRCLEYGQRLQYRARNVLCTRERRSTGRTLLDGASSGGAQALRLDTSQLAVGAIADVVALSDAHPSMVNRERDAALDSWIFAAAPAIDCVWSAGRKLVVHGRHIERARISAAYVKALRELTS